jgi:hypothetical protein
MTSSLLFLGMAVLAMVVGALHDTRRVKTVLAKNRAPDHLPKVVSALLIAVQFSEMLKVVHHASLLNVVGALLLLAIMLAAKGTEEVRHGS